jgi:hypothetical protein
MIIRMAKMIINKNIPLLEPEKIILRVKIIRKILKSNIWSLELFF